MHILPLGAGQEVGRSCIIASMKGTTVMLDCGLHMGYTDHRRYPDLSLASAIDLVVITHFHTDHVGALPILTEKYGYNGIIIMTPPTLSISRLVLKDCMRANKLYSQKDIDSCLNKVVLMNFFETRVFGNASVTCYPAGHVLGACMFFIESCRCDITASASLNQNSCIAVDRFDFRPDNINNNKYQVPYLDSGSHFHDSIDKIAAPTNKSNLLMKNSEFSQKNVSARNDQTKYFQARKDDFNGHSSLKTPKSIFNSLEKIRNMICDPDSRLRHHNFTNSSNIGESKPSVMYLNHKTFNDDASMHQKIYSCKNEFDSQQLSLQKNILVDGRKFESLVDDKIEKIQNGNIQNVNMEKHAILNDNTVDTLFHKDKFFRIECDRIKSANFEIQTADKPHNLGGLFFLNLAKFSEYEDLMPNSGKELSQDIDFSLFQKSIQANVNDESGSVEEFRFDSSSDITPISEYPSKKNKKGIVNVDPDLYEIKKNSSRVILKNRPQDLKHVDSPNNKLENAHFPCDGQNTAQKQHLSRIEKIPQKRDMNNKINIEQTRDFRQNEKSYLTRGNSKEPSIEKRPLNETNTNYRSRLKLESNEWIEKDVKYLGSNNEESSHNKDDTIDILKKYHLVFHTEKNLAPQSTNDVFSPIKNVSYICDAKIDSKNIQSNIQSCDLSPNNKSQNFSTQLPFYKNSAESLDTRKSEKIKNCEPSDKKILQQKNIKHVCFNEKESLLYTGDFSTAADRHLPAAVCDRSPDVIICESTYGRTVRGCRRAKERAFLAAVHSAVASGGKVLVPTFALGRAQELCLLLDAYWQKMRLPAPIYLAHGMGSRASNLFKRYASFTNEAARGIILAKNLYVPDQSQDPCLKYKHYKNSCVNHIDDIENSNVICDSSDRLSIKTNSLPNKKENKELLRDQYNIPQNKSPEIFRKVFLEKREKDANSTNSKYSDRCSSNNDSRDSQKNLCLNDSDNFHDIMRRRSLESDSIVNVINSESYLQKSTKTEINRSKSLETFSRLYMPDKHLKHMKNTCDLNSLWAYRDLQKRLKVPRICKLRDKVNHTGQKKYEQSFQVSKSQDHFLDNFNKDQAILIEDSDFLKNRKPGKLIEDSQIIQMPPQNQSSTHGLIRNIEEGGPNFSKMVQANFPHFVSQCSLANQKDVKESGNSGSSSKWILEGSINDKKPKNNTMEHQLKASVSNSHFEGLSSDWKYKDAFDTVAKNCFEINFSKNENFADMDTSDSYCDPDAHESLQEKINTYTNFPKDRNSFCYKHVKPLDHKLIDNPGPAVILASPAMLHSGYSLQIFLKICENPKNLVIIPGYCMRGTVGDKVLKGEKQITYQGKTYDINLEVRNMGFSAHADAKGILQMIKNTSPKNAVLVHGDKQSMISMKKRIEKELKITTYTPENGTVLHIPCVSEKKFVINRKITRNIIEEWESSKKVDLKLEITNDNDEYRIISAKNYIFRENKD